MPFVLLQKFTQISIFMIVWHSTEYMLCAKITHYELIVYHIVDTLENSNTLQKVTKNSLTENLSVSAEQRKLRPLTRIQYKHSFSTA